MAKQFRADNIGSLLRPPELLQARAAYREGKLQRDQLRDIEDRSILKALELQKAAGVEVFTDGEYRRDIFTADITQAVDGLVPGKVTVSFEWRGAGSELAKESKEGNLQFIVGGKLRKKGRFTPGEATFLQQHAPGPFKVCTPAATQHAISRYRPGVTDKVYPTIHDMLQDVAMIMRGRGPGIDRRRGLLCPARRAVLFDLLRPEAPGIVAGERHRSRRSAWTRRSRPTTR